MTYVPKEGFGNLFRNRKTKDTQPDMKGDVMWKGELLEVAGWTKEGKNGKFLSLKVQSKSDQFQQGMEQARQPLQEEQKQEDFHDDDIPF